ncbi:MAG: hypothetical protein V3575_04055 [Candidatus Absconditabacteria bacterium]
MADDVNLYSYVGNSPVMKVDLLGLWGVNVSGIKNTFKAGADGLYNIGSYAIDGIKCPFKQIVNGALYGDMLENPTGWNMLGQIGIGFTPAGWAGDVRDVGYQVSQGNYGMALVNGIGFIPGVGDGLEMILKGPIKKAGATVGDAISGMSDSVVKSLRETGESINNIDLSFVFATVDGAPLRVGNLTSNFKNNVSSFLESTKNSLSKVQNFSSSGGKKVPNPNGKNGGAAHQEKIAEIVEKIGDSAITEHGVDIKNGNKSKRYLDVYDPKSNKGVQVGKQNKNGTPVARERKAIQDLESEGINVDFIPYN